MTKTDKITIRRPTTLYTMRGLAPRLGIAYSTVRHHVCVKKTLRPTYEVGRVFLFSEEDVIEWEEETGRNELHRIKLDCHKGELKCMT